MIKCEDRLGKGAAAGWVEAGPRALISLSRIENTLMTGSEGGSCWGVKEVCGCANADSIGINN